jgi:hypothetical protein
LFYVEAVSDQMNPTLLNDATTRLELTVAELHTVRDALATATWSLEADIAQTQQLISKLANLSPEEIAETLAETDSNADSLAELEHGLKRDEKLLRDIQSFRHKLEEFVQNHDLARQL